MTISFKGGFSYNLKDAATSVNRDLKEGLDKNAFSNLADFKTYTPDSFELDIDTGQSRPHYHPNMDFMESVKYFSARDKAMNVIGKLIIVDNASGDKFVVSSRVTNEDDTVNPEKFQKALNELSLDRIKELSIDFNEKITGCQNKIKKELSNNALQKLLYNKD